MYKWLKIVKNYVVNKFKVNTYYVNYFKHISPCIIDTITIQGSINLMISVIGIGYEEDIGYLLLVTQSPTEPQKYEIYTEQ